MFNGFEFSFIKFSYNFPPVLQNLLLSNKLLMGKKNGFENSLIAFSGKMQITFLQNSRPQLDALTFSECSTSRIYKYRLMLSSK